MKVNKKLWLLLTMSALVGCNKSIEESEQTVIQTPLVKSYQPRGFVADQRIEKIQTLTRDLQSIFENHAKERHIPGIAYGIVVDDSLVIASHTGITSLSTQTPVSASSSFRIASMSKSFTSMAILKLRDDGKLSLDNPVVDYIPELASLEYLTEDSPIIDIENLLTMTAGFPEDNPWGDRQLAISDDAFMDLIANGLSLSKIPSYQYEYSNTGYAMLGRIISVVSGISYQEYIKENIFKPLGMNHTYWEYSEIPEDQFVMGYRWEDEQWKEEPILHDGAYGAMGGIITSIEDFSKYVSYLLSAWPPRSAAESGPVKRSTLREMQTPQFNFLNSRATDWNDQPCASMIGYGYGLGISMNCKRIKRVSHGGALPGYGSNYAFFPEYGVGLMAFGNLTYTSPIPYDPIEKLLFEDLELTPRELPASDVLIKTQKALAELLQQEPLTLDSEIFAENFFLDRSKKNRIEEIQEIQNRAGSTIGVTDVSARNQLRGDFYLQGEKGDVRIFFTLTPEHDPKVQRLDVSFHEKPSEDN